MRTLSRRLISLVLLFGLMMGGISVKPVQADRAIAFTVNSFVDANDYAINSVCSVGSANAGDCTLRAAIDEANWNGDTADIVINLPAGNYDLTIPPTGINDITSGDLNFNRTNPGYTISLVGIDAEPAVIDAQQLDRVINISLDVNVSLENVIIKGGLLSWTGTAEYPDGAGILNYGKLVLNDVIIEENEARCGQTSCVMYIVGGGIYNLGDVYMTDSIIRNNTSVAGSAIFSSTSEDGYFFLKNSTISGNHSTQGGTIINYAKLQIRNSTIAGNTADEASIVGILNYETLILESSTIVNAGITSSIYNAGTGSVTIQDTVLKNITSPGSYNCNNDGTWTSNGYNVFSDNTCPATGTGDLVNTDPLLGALGLWGGTTMTMPLQTGSPAKNHRPSNCMTIPESPAVPPLPLTIDQRYYTRSDGLCDTGAFEGTLDIRTVFLPLMFR